jgi:hypothetical protein
MFVHDRPFQPSLIYASKLEPNRVKYRSGAPLCGSILALPTTIRQIRKGLPGTNTLAYYKQTVSCKHFYFITDISIFITLGLGRKCLAVTNVKSFITIDFFLSLQQSTLLRTRLPSSRCQPDESFSLSLTVCQNKLERLSSATIFCSGYEHTRVWRTFLLSLKTPN